MAETTGTTTIRLLKALIDQRIDAHTDKRNDATPGYSEAFEPNERVGNAVSSDTTEDMDGFIVSRYRDRWDARLRLALRYCLVEDEEETDGTDDFVVDNIPDYTQYYVYKFSFHWSKFGKEKIRSVAKLMEDYIVRGTLYDWYTNVNLQPLDTEDSLDDLLDEIEGSFRGRSWVRRPLQPFGPAEWPPVDTD